MRNLGNQQLEQIDAPPFWKQNNFVGVLNRKNKKREEDIKKLGLIPEAEDPKEMFDYYYDKLYGDNKSSSSGVTIDDLNRKIDDLTKQLNEARLIANDD